MRPVLAKPLAMDPHMAELALGDPERMLDLGPYLCNEPIDLSIDFIQLYAPSSLTHDNQKTCPLN